MKNNRSLFPPLFGEIPTGGGGGGSGNKIQLAELPEASLQYKDKIVQYIGATTETLTNGYFYKCVEHTTTEGGTITVTYSWDNVDVQSTSGLTLEAELTTDGVLDMQHLFYNLFSTITLDENKRYIFARSGVTLYEGLRQSTGISFSGAYAFVSDGSMTSMREEVRLDRELSNNTWMQNANSQPDTVPSAGGIYRIYSYNL